MVVLRICVTHIRTIILQMVQFLFCFLFFIFILPVCMYWYFLLQQNFIIPTGYKGSNSQICSVHRGGGTSRLGVCQDIIWKTRSWTKVGNVFGECHTPCMLKTSFEGFKKEYVHCSHYKRLSFSSLTNSSYFPATVKSCPNQPISISFQYYLCILLNLLSSEHI